MALHPLELRHLLELALDVALVLDGDLNFLRNVGRQGWPSGVEGGQLGVVKLGPLQQRQQRTAIRGIGSAVLRQKCRQGRRGGHAGVFQPLDLLFDGDVLFLHRPEPFLRHQADLIAPPGEPLVGVVLPQHQTVLAAGGHDAVRLVGALRHQIVDQGTDVALRPGKDKGAFPFQLPGSVDTRHKALDGGLLVSGGAVELPRAVQPRHLFRFQRGQQAQRIDAVIFDGIGRAGHHGVPQAGDAVEHLDLHLLRHGGGKALDVQFLGVQTHGLHEQLVAELIREADDLRFKAGAVPGADALDQPGVHGGPVQIFLDDALGLLGGPRQPAHRLVIGRVLRGIGEGHRNLVPRLDLHLVKVHGPGVDPGGRAGLEPPQGQAQLQ